MSDDGLTATADVEITVTDEAHETACARASVRCPNVAVVVVTWTRPCCGPRVQALCMPCHDFFHTSPATPDGPGLSICEHDVDDYEISHQPIGRTR